MPETRQHSPWRVRRKWTTLYRKMLELALQHLARYNSEVVDVWESEVDVYKAEFSRTFEVATPYTRYLITVTAIRIEEN